MRGWYNNKGKDKGKMRPVVQGINQFFLLDSTTPTATPTTMAMMMTGEVSGADAFGVEILTNDDQRIPLPTPSVLCALDGAAQLGVGLLDVAVRLLGALVDLRNGRLLLVYQLGDFVVQLAECDEVLFDLANGGGTLESGLAGIVGLASTGTGNLFGN
jgi:hypothetical protein